MMCSISLHDTLMNSLRCDGKIFGIFARDSKRLKPKVYFKSLKPCVLTHKHCCFSAMTLLIPMLFNGMGNDGYLKYEWF